MLWDLLFLISSSLLPPVDGSIVVADMFKNHLKYKDTFWDFMCVFPLVFSGFLQLRLNEEDDEARNWKERYFVQQPSPDCFTVTQRDWLLPADPQEEKEEKFAVLFGRRAPRRLPCGERWSGQICFRTCQRNYQVKGQQTGWVLQKKGPGPPEKKSPTSKVPRLSR